MPEKRAVITSGYQCFSIGKENASAGEGSVLRCELTCALGLEVYAVNGPIGACGVGNRCVGCNGESESSGG